MKFLHSIDGVINFSLDFLIESLYVLFLCFLYDYYDNVYAFIWEWNR